MEEVSNVKSDDFYFHLGTDLGAIANQNFRVYDSGNLKTTNLLPEFYKEN